MKYSYKLSWEPRISEESSAILSFPIGKVIGYGYTAIAAIEKKVEQKRMKKST